MRRSVAFFAQDEDRAAAGVQAEGDHDPRGRGVVRNRQEETPRGGQRGFSRAALGVRAIGGDLCLRGTGGGCVEADVVLAVAVAAAVAAVADVPQGVRGFISSVDIPGQPIISKASLC